MDNRKWSWKIRRPRQADAARIKNIFRHQDQTDAARTENISRHQDQTDAARTENISRHQDQTDAARPEYMNRHQEHANAAWTENNGRQEQTDAVWMENMDGQHADADWSENMSMQEDAGDKIQKENERYKSLFRQLVKEEEQLHAQNQKRIKAGIQCLIWIPMVFLAMLFLTDSEKVIFLVLWVVSLFAIASYLIYIEYIDFKAQERLHRYTDQENVFRSGLIGADIEVFEETVTELLRQIDERKAQNRQKMLQMLEQQKEKFL